MREYLIKIAVEIMTMTKTIDPIIIVPRFLITLLLASLSLYPLIPVVFMI